MSSSLRNMQARAGSTWAASMSRSASTAEAARRLQKMKDFARAHNIKIKASPSGQESARHASYGYIAIAGFGFAATAGAFIGLVNDATHEPVLRTVEGRKIITRRLSSFAGFNAGPDANTRAGV